MAIGGDKNTANIKNAELWPGTYDRIQCGTMRAHGLFSHSTPNSAEMSGVRAFREGALGPLFGVRYRLDALQKFARLLIFIPYIVLS